MQIVDLYDSDFYHEYGEEAFGDDIWGDCDYLLLGGTGDEEPISVSAVKETDEVLYLTDSIFNKKYVRQLLDDFYNYDNPRKHGFVSLDGFKRGFRDLHMEVDVTQSPEYLEGRPILKYRGGNEYSCSFWQYNK